ncbi:MAG TPA: prepilin-type N-terminal cleavage/methylation domain-containing protein [Thermoanaerobaculia bacterium]|nr:prepilin-type N-terminal cleavage/methylation domain-containing protein [Thermoanaerobaculia bacterium]
MVKRRTAGYTLLEVVVAMAIFGIVLMILTILTAEMNRQEKRYPVNFMKHPQMLAVVARMRRDVFDIFADDPYPSMTKDEKYTQGPETLIMNILVQGRGQRTVVWDFHEPGVARRIEYNVGVPTQWVARGLPPEGAFRIGSDDVSSYGPPAVHLRVKDAKGVLAIDQILQPRTHN